MRLGLRRSAIAIAAALCGAGSVSAQPASLSGMDRDKDGRTSRAEYRGELVSVTLRYDRDGDGRVTRTELPAIARLPGAKSIVERIFKSNDANGDGALARDELLARADVRFTELDASGDGYLDAAEIKAARSQRR